METVHGEHYWFSPSVAAERKESSKYTIINPGAPLSTLDGTHTFGTVAIGHSDIVYHPEATGLYVAIDTVTGSPIVYTDHSPHQEFIPMEKEVRKVGTFDPAEIVVLCVPTGPTEFKYGNGGLAKGEMTPWQLEFTKTACETAGLPTPRVAGRPVAGRRWDDPTVKQKITALETLDC